MKKRGMIDFGIGAGLLIFVLWATDVHIYTVIAAFSGSLITFGYLYWLKTYVMKIFKSGEVQ